MLQMTFGSRTIKTDRNAFVMGIVNATPDSFYEKSRGGLALAMELIEQGADILDIGGESTRPGFTDISTEEEIERVVPLIREIRKRSDIVISVDTRKAAVFKQAFDCGADIFNDVSALEYDSESLAAAAKSGASVVLMHGFSMQNTNIRKSSSDIIKVVDDFFEQRTKAALKAGIKGEKIILDPGIGFGKNYEENLALIKSGNVFCGGKYAFLMALSRKKCIGTMTGRDINDRMAGSVAASLISVQKGAKIVRVHDVKEMVDALNVEKNLLM